VTPAPSSYWTRPSRKTLPQSSTPTPGAPAAPTSLWPAHWGRHWGRGRGRGREGPAFSAGPGAPGSVLPGVESEGVTVTPCPAPVEALLPSERGRVRRTLCGAHWVANTTAPYLASLFSSLPSSYPTPAPTAASCSAELSGAPGKLWGSLLRKLLGKLGVCMLRASQGPAGRRPPWLPCACWPQERLAACTEQRQPPPARPGHRREPRGHESRAGG